MRIQGFQLIFVFQLLLFQTVKAERLPCKDSLPVTVNQIGSDSLRYQITGNSKTGYGYDIYKRGNLLIHQSTIPCITGKKGFVTSKDAAKIAGLVLQKIRNGIMPPTLTVHDLQVSGVKY